MSGVPFRVLRAGVEHLDALTPLFDAYRQFYERSSDVASAGAYLRDRLSRDESVVFLAMEGEGRALGFTQLYPLFSSVRLKPMYLLNDLYVAPEGRRRGVARALLERAKRHAVDSGAGGLELQTAKDNAAAQALYRREGWQLETDYLRFFLDVD